MAVSTCSSKLQTSMHIIIITMFLVMESLNETLMVIASQCRLMYSGLEVHPDHRLEVKVSVAMHNRHRNYREVGSIHHDMK